MYLWAYKKINKSINCCLKANTRDEILQSIKSKLDIPQVYDSKKVLEEYVDMEKILTPINQNIVYLIKSVCAEYENRRYILSEFKCPCGCGLVCIEINNLKEK